jgi:hypothetical protein
MAEGLAADRDAAAAEHGHPFVAGRGDQLGDQAGLARPGVAPHERDPAVAPFDPPQQVSEGGELPVATDKPRRGRQLQRSPLAVPARSWLLILRGGDWIPRGHFLILASFMTVPTTPDRVTPGR